jgi:RNase P/RNase MRP subunit POP5
MKPLNPADREKKRYLLLEGENLRKNVPRAILEFVGILGMANASPTFIKENKNSAIVQINRKYLNEVRASFVLFESKIEVKRVSGTIKGLNKK